MASHTWPKPATAGTITLASDREVSGTIDDAHTPPRAIPTAGAGPGGTPCICSQNLGTRVAAVFVRASDGDKINVCHQETRQMPHGVATRRMRCGGPVGVGPRLPVVSARDKRLITRVQQGWKSWTVTIPSPGERSLCDDWGKPLGDWPRHPPSPVLCHLQEPPVGRRPSGPRCCFSFHGLFGDDLKRQREIYYYLIFIIYYYYHLSFPPNI